MTRNHDLSKPVRQTPKKSEFVPHTMPIIGTRWSHPEYTDTGALTLWGVYNSLLLFIQNDREWEQSTCRIYDAVVSNYLAPAFKGLAFASLSEDDFVAIWDKLRQRIVSENDRDICRRMLRLIVDYGQRYDYTCVSLWGIPDLQDGVTSDMLDNIVLTSPELEDVAQQNTVEKEGLETAKKGVRIARAMPLATEFRVARLLLSQYSRFGELLAALFMWLAGLRPSEATALNFSHLGKINGRWGIAMYQVSEQHSRETHDGGKSKNAPRFIPLPKFFACLLLARKATLAKHYPNQDINTFPIACRGTDHKMRCTTNEVNGRLKSIFRAAGVEESMIAAAYESMRDNPEIAEDCEKRVVAYLLRHQFATACKYCGLTDDECSAMMGHKLGSPGALKTDYVNPDKFLALAQKLDQRPIVVLLDRLSSRTKIAFSESPLDIYTQTPTDIYFDCDTHFELTLYAQNTNTDLILDIDKEISIATRGASSVPEVFSANSTGITSFLMQYSNIYAQYYYDDNMDASKVITACKSRAVMDDPNLLASLKASPLSAKLLQAQIETPSSVPAPSGPETFNEIICLDPNNNTGNAKPNTNPLILSPTVPLPSLIAQSNHSVYAVDSNGNVHAISSEAYIVRSRDRRGVRLCQENDTHQIRRLLMHDRNLPAYILTIDGALYVLPPMLVLDSADFHATYKSCCDALSAGAIFFQPPKCYDPPIDQPTIVCLSSTGDVVRIKLPTKPTSPQTPIHLISVMNTHLASACICADSEDVLLVSAKGKALRLPAETLRTNRSYGVGMIQGITLSDNDHAVACIPYNESAQYLVTTSTGMMIYLAPLQLLAHGRGSQGVALVSLYDTDTVVTLTQAQAAALLATNDGYSLCVNMADVSPLNRGAKGIKGIKTTKCHLIDTVPLQIEGNL